MTDTTHGMRVTSATALEHRAIPPHRHGDAKDHHAVVDPPVGVNAVATSVPGSGARIDGYPMTATPRRLSDLLAAASASPPDPELLHQAVADGHDPVLYEAYRDYLPPRPGVITGAAEGWFADLVIYRPGILPNAEPVRSIGHWNSPGQLEIFQTLTGHVLMLTAGTTTDASPYLYGQTCGPGEFAVVPFGGWHLTYVLDGPATVLNVYADHPSPLGYSSRHAAVAPDLKYHAARPTARVCARMASGGIELHGATPQTTTTPGWLTAFLPEGSSLEDFYLTANNRRLADLMTTAWHHR
jgi:hypothetical protein